MHSTLLLFASFAACRASLWPLPASVTTAPEALTLSSTFSFSSTSSSAILASAFRRYTSIVALRALPASPFAGGIAAGAGVEELVVVLLSDSETLGPGTSEAYNLSVTVPRSTLTAATVYGALRGLETWSQLCEYTPSAVPSQFIVVASNVTDAPRFSHRGALIDTGRHFIPLPQIFSFLDAAAYNKLSVFHWHVVDDQSFPFVSTTFPALSAQGAFGALASHTYSPADVDAVLAYARDRGIRVVVEFDTPGHSQSWGPGQPGLLTPCYNNATPPAPDGTFGPIDPTRNETFTFLASFFKEVAARFADDIHIGGDEVSFACWASNPNVNAWMAGAGIAPGNYAALESYYVQRVLDIVTALGRRSIGWEELYDNGLVLPPATVVNVWKYHNGVTPPPPHSRTWQSELANVTAAGFDALLSSPWYLNVISYGVDWPEFYSVEPLAWPGTDAQKAHVIGGELSMWGEYVDGANLVSRLFPRASAVAERLWSPATVTDLADATTRINDQRCRLIARGLPAGALSPGYCPTELVAAYVPPWE